MPTTTTDPEILKERAEEYQSKWKSKTLDMAGLEAMVETNFRLAVHPATPPSEAVPLLLLAQRLDGANPKYAYHLARLFFIGADLGRASKWLKKAIDLCPTSHRLWSHVALLQRELNIKYRGQPEFEPDDLRKLASDVTALIRDGKDRFPPVCCGFHPKPAWRRWRRKPGARGSATP